MSSQHRYNRVLKSSPSAPHSGDDDFAGNAPVGPFDPFASPPTINDPSSYKGSLDSDINRRANWGETSSAPVSGLAPSSGSRLTPPGLRGSNIADVLHGLTHKSPPNSGNHGHGHHARVSEPVTSHLGKFPSAPQPAGTPPIGSNGMPPAGAKIFTPSSTGVVHLTGSDIVGSLTGMLRTPPSAFSPSSISAPAPPPALTAGSAVGASSGSNAAGLNILARLQQAQSATMTPSSRRIPVGVIQPQQQTAFEPRQTSPSTLMTTPSSHATNKSPAPEKAKSPSTFPSQYNNNTPSAKASKKEQVATSPSKLAKQAKHEAEEHTAPLISRQVILPPQHEVFVLFPTAAALNNHLNFNGGASVASTPMSITPSATPSGPSVTPVDASTAAKTMKGCRCGYRIIKASGSGVRPRVYAFGQFDTLPCSVAVQVPEGIGMLFYNDDAASTSSAAVAQPTSADNGFVDAASAHLSGTPDATQVSCTAEILLHNVVSVSEVRPIDGTAKNIHNYLNTLRYDAVENQTRGPNVLIVGNSDTGKSSLANYLVNAHLKEGIASLQRYKLEKSQAMLKRKNETRKNSKEQGAEGDSNEHESGPIHVTPSLPAQIQLIDLDIGQGVSLPGCVSATNSIILQKAPYQSGLSVFYGDTSICNDDDKNAYLNCVKNLIRTVDTNMCIDRFETDLKRMGNYPSAIGRVINTMGYTISLGFEILVEVVKLCKVDVIVVTGNNSELQFNLKDEIQRRYGSNKHFTMPTFILYNAPDCPTTSKSLRKHKREGRILEYFRSMRFGDIATGSASGKGQESPMFGTVNGTPAGSAASMGSGSFAGSFPSQPSPAFPPYMPDPTRRLIYSVPLSRLTLLEAKTFAPIVGQGFNKLGQNKLAAIPVPAYNEIGGIANNSASLGFFPLLSPLPPAGKGIEGDTHQVPNGRGVLAFVGLLGLNNSTNSLDLIIDPSFVEERSRQLGMLRGGEKFEAWGENQKAAAIAAAKKFLFEGKERIILLVSNNVFLPDDAVRIVRD